MEGFPRIISTARAENTPDNEVYNVPDYREFQINELTAANDENVTEAVPASSIEKVKTESGDLVENVSEEPAANEVSAEALTKEAVIKESEDLLATLMARTDLTPETKQLVNKSYADINLLNSYSESDPKLFKQNSERYLQMVVDNHRALLELDSENKKVNHEAFVEEEKDVDAKLESAIADFKQVQGKLEGLKVNDPNLEANISQGLGILGIIENYSEDDPVRAKIEKEKYLKTLKKNSISIMGILGSQIDSTDSRFNEYQNAREQWREAKSEYKEKEKQYNESLKEYYGDKSFGAKMRSLKEGVGKLFGIKPELPIELQLMRDGYKNLKQEYAKNLDKALLERGKVKFGNEYVDKENKEYSGLEDDNTKMVFAEKFILEPGRKLLEIQGTGLSSEKQTRLASIMKGLGKYKWHTRGGVMVAAGIAGALTGGIGAAVVGAGMYATRTAVGLGAGALAGGVTHKGFEKSVKLSKERAESAAEAVLNGFSIESLNQLEKEMLDAKTEAEMKAFQQKGWSVVAGALAGGASSIGVGMAANTPFMSEARAGINNFLDKTSDINTAPGHAFNADDLAKAQNNYGVDGTKIVEMPVSSEYVVVEGDELWNIVKDKYSGMLEGVSPSEQNRLLDELLDKVRTDEGLRNSIGLDNYGKSIDNIYPGDKIELGKLGEVLQNMIEQKQTIGTSVPVSETHVGNSFDNVLPREKLIFTPLSEGLVDNNILDVPEVASIASEVVTPPEEIKTLYDVVIDRGGLQNSRISMVVEGVPAEDVVKMERMVNETMYDMARNQGDIPVDDFKAIVLHKAYAQIQQEYPTAEIKSLEFAKPHELVTPVEMNVKDMSSEQIRASSEVAEQYLVSNEVIVPKFVDGTMKIGNYNMHLGGLNPEQINIVEVFAKEAAARIVENNPNISMDQLGTQVSREVLDNFKDTELWKSVNEVNFSHSSSSGSQTPIETPQQRYSQSNVYDQNIRQNAHGDYSQMNPERLRNFYPDGRRGTFHTSDDLQRTRISGGDRNSYPGGYRTSGHHGHGGRR